MPNGNQQTEPASVAQPTVGAQPPETDVQQALRATQERQAGLAGRWKPESRQAFEATEAQGGAPAALGTAGAIHQAGEEMQKLRAGTYTQFQNPVTRDALNKLVPSLLGTMTSVDAAREGYLRAVRDYQGKFGDAAPEIRRTVETLTDSGMMNAKTTAIQAVSYLDQMQYNRNVAMYEQKRQQVNEVIAQQMQVLQERMKSIPLSEDVWGAANLATEEAQIWSQALLDENLDWSNRARAYPMMAMTTMHGRTVLANLAHEEGLLGVVAKDTQRLGRMRSSLQRVVSATGAAVSGLAANLPEPADLFRLTPEDMSRAQDEGLSPITYITAKLLRKTGMPEVAAPVVEILRSPNPSKALNEIFKTGDVRGLSPQEVFGMLAGAHAVVTDWIYREATKPGSTGIHSVITGPGGAPGKPEDAWRQLVAVAAQLRTVMDSSFVSAPVDQAASQVQTMLAMSHAPKNLLKLGASLTGARMPGELAALSNLTAMYDQIKEPLMETIRNAKDGMAGYAAGALGRLQAILAWATAKTEHPDLVPNPAQAPGGSELPRQKGGL